jgi:hypothetical protein
MCVPDLRYVDNFPSGVSGLQLFVPFPPGIIATHSWAALEPAD